MFVAVGVPVAFAFVDAVILKLLVSVIESIVNSVLASQDILLALNAVVNIILSPATAPCPVMLTVTELEPLVVVK